MGATLLSLLFFLLLIITIEFFCLYYSYLLFCIFFCGDEDVAFLDEGRWSRVCGHLLQVVT
jgi:hypothetical protein